MAAVGELVCAAFGDLPTALDDLFVVKYDAREQRELLSHVDAGEGRSVGRSPRRGAEHQPRRRRAAPPESRGRRATAINQARAVGERRAPRPARLQHAAAPAVRPISVDRESQIRV